MAEATPLGTVSFRASCRRMLALCRGDPEVIVGWVEERNPHWLWFCVAIIVVGCGLYGFTLGLWRSPTQALYAAVKFPLVVLLTLLGNALLNGMLAQTIGLRITFRQTSMAILMSFAIVALVLGALTPIALFVLYNTAPLASPHRDLAHGITKLTHVLAIAYAGVAANTRLYRCLARLGNDSVLARRILLAWLAGNLFLGSQLTWILRPFIGSPFLDVQFLRPNAFAGNFYEDVYQTFHQLLHRL